LQHATLFPFADLNVGESFFVPCVRGDGIARRVVDLARYHARAKGRTYTTRRLRDGIRVWRTA